MDNHSLGELVQQSRDGSAQAMEKLVNACQPVAFKLALSILDDPDDADDVAQEAIIHAIHAIPSYRAEAAFQTWFYRIVINSCLGRLRKRKARQRLDKLLAAFFRHDHQREASVEKQVVLDEDSQRIIHYINDLDPKYRLPIVLRYYHDLPIAQIADILDVSTRTVHTRLKQAHDLIRMSLGEPDASD